MGTRMFVAVYPPEDVREELAAFLEPRPGLRWTPPDQMHLTLAFMESVPDNSVETLTDLLHESCSEVPGFLCGLRGAGAFPHPDRPAVLWMGVQDGAEQLSVLARRARHAANRAGTAPDGRTFTPHLTLARPARGTNATRWIRILETFSSRLWEVDEVHLVESVLQGHGRRPRHHSVDVFPLSATR